MYMWDERPICESSYTCLSHSFCYCPYPLHLLVPLVSVQLDYLSSQRQDALQRLEEAYSRLDDQIRKDKEKRVMKHETQQDRT